MPRFEINEVAIINTPDNVDFHDRECTILGLEADGDYIVDVQGVSPSDYGKKRFSIKGLFLRKKHPPMGDWESLESNIGWERPVEVVT